MRAVPLDARLRAVADAVRAGSSIADVGTDHGSLICALALEGRIRGGVACDLREGPLCGARALVRSLGLDGRVQVRLCDGLDGVLPDEADDIVIAGLGGKTIDNIIRAAPWLRDPGKRLVLQPQTKAPDLRRSLCRAGFALEGERGVRAGRFIYTVFTARWSGAARELDDFAALVGLLPESAHPDSAGFLRALAARLRGAGERAGRSACGLGEARRLLGHAARIEALLGAASIQHREERP